MRNKKIIKYVCVTFIIVLVVILITNSAAYAKINTGIINSITADSQFNDLGNGVLGMIQTIGIFAAVAGLMIIGIKYMLSSAEEKSQQKEVLIYYLIGSIMVLSIVGVVKLIYNFAKDLF